MKILIVDDEPLARERLTHLLTELNHDYQLIEASNGLEAIDQVNNEEPDIVLMDIRMPGMNGLEATSHLMSIDNPPAIIFTTAYDEYALQAFESQAVDYLLKPIRKERLEKALNSCSKLNKLQLEQLGQQNREISYRTHISAQIRNNLFLIAIKDIYCFLADHKYVTVKYNKEGALAETIIEDTLKSLEEEFENSFLRIHRNALIRKDNIEALQKQSDGRVLLKLKDLPEGLEVSRRHLSRVRKLMKT
ncbi:MAG: LytTR family DNA-binding domain-containing protein [gamma proteobacterium symbiont of Lucinoma myriamae]|nr:LytTR family DNA-binding domain-containing protein [gamma proteobacterium symbiont of Lucinoma myriamae]MCU7819009.1 LytTR family DNA-binding domain-containing protein [gamma proteobacterium symbiont of Lucinoma myriamae]MCU7832060.1 LytTR family DNA-binding domain-containing protein [gamma proteobacterium symbiont of Lucinoma myriamae]